MHLYQPLLFLAFLACRGEADLVSSCDSNDCLQCREDIECVVSHNPCNETAVCHHVNEDIAVTSLGCSPAIEYGTPPDEACVCDVSLCTPQ